MKDSTPHKSKDKNEENKFKTTIHNMIYKLIEDDDAFNSIDFQENVPPQNPQPQINPLNNPYIPYYSNNNNDMFLFQNIFNTKERKTFPNININQGIEKYKNNFDLNKNQNIIRDQNRKRTYDTPTAGHNSKIEMEILINKIKAILEKNGKLDFHVYKLIKGKFLAIIKNHKGSKIFQKYIKPNNTSDEIIHLLFLELSKNLEDFMTNPYSNYFFKKFFICLNSDDRIYLLKKIEKSIVKLSLDEIGTYPIQTIIEFLDNKIEKLIVINAIKDHIQELIFNQYGSYVVEKLISSLDENDIPFLYSFIAMNFIQLSFNNNAICVIKKLLSQKLSNYMHNLIKNYVIKNCKEFILHPCGNFVVQGIVEYWDDYLEIVGLYKNNFFDLSLEKYASNVIERFIERDEKVLENYIEEIIESKKIYEIMKSKSRRIRTHKRIQYPVQAQKDRGNRRTSLHRNKSPPANNPHRTAKENGSSFRTEARRNRIILHPPPIRCAVRLSAKPPYKPHASGTDTCGPFRNSRFPFHRHTAKPVPVLLFSTVPAHTDLRMHPGTQ